MSVWSSVLIVGTVGSITYSMRAVAIVALANRAIPAPAARVLRYVGPAVLAALTINLAAGGESGPSIESTEILALVAAAGFAWWRKNLIVSLAAGMITLWVASALI